jgi:hypothetical protein
MNLTGHVIYKFYTCKSLYVDKNTNENVFSFHEMPKVYHVYKAAEKILPSNTNFEIMVS